MNEKIEAIIDQIVAYNPVLEALHNQLVEDNKDPMQMSIAEFISIVGVDDE